MNTKKKITDKDSILNLLGNNNQPEPIQPEPIQPEPEPEPEKTEEKKIPRIIKLYSDFSRGTERLSEPDKNNFSISTDETELWKMTPKTNKMTSSHRIRILTFDLTKSYTKDSQNNLILIQRFINKTFTNESTTKLLEPTLSLGKINFRTENEKRITFDLTTDPNYQKIRKSFKSDLLNFIKIDK